MCEEDDFAAKCGLLLQKIADEIGDRIEVPKDHIERDVVKDVHEPAARIKIADYECPAVVGNMLFFDHACVDHQAPATAEVAPNRLCAAVCHDNPVEIHVFAGRQIQR